MKTIFISHSSKDTVSDLRKLIYEFNYRIKSSVRFGEEINSSIIRSIESSDIFIVITNKENLPSYIWFELGIAIGRGMPIIAIVDKQTSLLLEALSSEILQLNYKDLDRLPQILEKMSKKTLPSKILENGKLHEISVQPGSKIENIVLDILQSSGNIFSQQEITNKEGFVPDFAVWIDSLSEYFGNPIYIEVKGHLSNLIEVEQLKIRFMKNRNISNYNSLLVLYEGGINSEDANRAFKESNIVFENLSNFVQSVSISGLASTIFSIFEESDLSKS